MLVNSSNIKVYTFFSENYTFLNSAVESRNTSKGKSWWKKQDHKKLRREQRKATAEALEMFYDDLEQDRLMQAEIDYEDFMRESYEEEEWRKALEDDYDYDDDGWGGFLSGDEYGFYESGEDYCFSPSTSSSPRHRLYLIVDHLKFLRNAIAAENAILEQWLNRRKAR